MEVFLQTRPAVPGSGDVPWHVLLNYACSSLETALFGRSSSAESEVGAAGVVRAEALAQNGTADVIDRQEVLANIATPVLQATFKI